MRVVSSVEDRSAHDNRCLGLKGDVRGVGTAGIAEYALLCDL